MMNKCWAILMTAVCLFSPGVPDPVEKSVCGTENRSTNQTTVSIQSKKDVSDEWVTTISSYSEGSQNGTNLHVTRRIIGCGGKDFIHVKAVIGGTLDVKGDYPVHKVKEQRILFHPKGGKNVVVSQDRRTVYRTNTEVSGDYAAVLTNRLLNKNELFEVKLDRIVGTYLGNIAIGVTPISPTDIQHQSTMANFAIITYNNDVYKFSIVIKNGYGTNLYALKVGQRLGVMIKDNGNMHVYVDGVDKGVASSGITFPVYGVIDLHQKAAQATIV